MHGYKLDEVRRYHEAAFLCPGFVFLDKLPTFGRNWAGAAVQVIDILLNF